MGQVWLATDERLQRSVAVKIVLPDATDAQLGLRLEREARAAAAIQHTNVVRVFDYLDDGGRTLIVMEHVEGETLADKLERDGALPLEDALDITAQICDGLTSAHRTGLVHRDLKPSNVMVTEDGMAKVLDFGIAKRTGRGESNLTMTGAVIGTPRYMAPEQLRGEELDARVDIHAAGLLLYEMLTGRAAFDRENFAELMYQLVNTTPDIGPLEARGVPPEVSAIILRATAKNRDDRFLDARSMADALRVCLFGDVLTARKTPTTAGLRSIIDSGERVLQRTTGSSPAIPEPVAEVAAATPAPLAPVIPTPPAAPVPPRSAEPTPKRAESARWPFVVVPGLVVAAIIAVVAYRATTSRAVVPAPVVDAASPVTTTPAEAAPVKPASAQKTVSAQPTTPAPEPAATPAAETPAADEATRAAEAKGTEAVRRALASAVEATWRFYLTDVTKEYGDEITDLHADFDVVVDEKGQFALVRGGAASDEQGFVDNAGAAVQNAAPIKVGAAKRKGGWPMRIRFAGKVVRVTSR